MAGPWLVSGNESTFHIESTKVGAPLSSSHLHFVIMPQFFPLLALHRWPMLACTPAWPLALQGRTAGASTSASKVPRPQQCSEQGASRGCCRCSGLWGTRQPEHPRHPSLGSLRGGWGEWWVLSSLQWGDLEHRLTALQSRGTMHDFWGQVRGCPPCMAPPDPPAVCPTAPFSITSVGETHSITAVAGGQLVLECPEDAVPPTRIAWHREGSPLQVRVTGPGSAHGPGWGTPSPALSRWWWGQCGESC